MSILLCVQKLRLFWSVFGFIWIYGWKACFMELNKEMEINVLKLWNHVLVLF
jgi:hypothetical protein